MPQSHFSFQLLCLFALIYEGHGGLPMLLDDIMSEFAEVDYRRWNIGPPITTTTENPEDFYTIDPALENDILDVGFLAEPYDFTGRSMVGTLKVHQMLRLVGSPLAEPYIGGALPVAPAAPGPAPAAAAPAAPFNPIPYIMFLQGGGAHGSASVGGGGGGSGGGSG